MNGAAIKDFELWIEATVLQCTLFLLPGFNYVPQPVRGVVPLFSASVASYMARIVLQVITSLIQSMGWLENVFTVSTPLWTPIVDYITDVVEKRSSPCEVVIIGHSLGVCPCVINQFSVRVIDCILRQVAALRRSLGRCQGTQLSLLLGLDCLSPSE